MMMVFYLHGLDTADDEMVMLVTADVFSS